MIIHKLLSLFTLALLASCASARPDRFYTLTSPSPSPSSSPFPAPSVVVAPAAVPEIIDRPQLVAFTDANRVAIMEQQRWAEPLRAAIARVVAQDLGRQLGGARVSTREEALGRPDCRVHLDVRRLDAWPGVAVDLDALWTVTCAGAGTRTGRSLARAPVLGPSTDAIVVAHGRALATLSGDLARALRDMAPVTVAATPSVTTAAADDDPGRRP